MADKDLVIQNPDKNEPAFSTAETMQYSRRQFLKWAAVMGGGVMAAGALKGLQVYAEQPAQSYIRPTYSRSSGGSQSVAPKRTPVHPANKTASTDQVLQEALANYHADTQVVPQNYDYLIGKVQGLSESQLKQHFALYEGYVKKINAIQEQLQKMALEDLKKMNATYSPFRELHVEQTYALNGVTLHEKYFESLNGLNTYPSNWLTSLFTKEFGSWDLYLNHAKSVAKSMRGWAVTAFNFRDGRFHNYGLDMHNQLVPMGVYPVMVLDVYEHAYMIEYGTNRDAYLNAFFENVNWNLVEKRAQSALALASHESFKV